MGHGRRRGAAGAFAWGSSGGGKSWTESEFVRVSGQAYLTTKRFLFKSGRFATEILPLSKVASVDADRRTIFIAADSPKGVNRYELRLKEDGPAERIVTQRWSQAILELCQRPSDTNYISIPKAF